LEFLSRAEAQISLPVFEQAVGISLVNVHAIALSVRREMPAYIGPFVPVDAEPVQIFQKLSLETSFAALQVGVLDAEDMGTFFLPREEPVDQRGSGVTHMQHARRRRRKTHSNFARRLHSRMVAKGSYGGHSSFVGQTPSPVCREI